VSLVITQVKSSNGSNSRQRDTLRSLLASNSVSRIVPGNKWPETILLPISAAILLGMRTLAGEFMAPFRNSCGRAHNANLVSAPKDLILRQLQRWRKPRDRAGSRRIGLPEQCHKRRGRVRRLVRFPVAPRPLAEQSLFASLRTATQHHPPLS